MTSRVVIVGAGQAGGRTAQALRRLGHTGAITLIGAESLPPYERPPLSKDVLLGRADPSSLLLLPLEAWAALDIDLRCATEVLEIDREGRSVRLSDGAVLGFDVLVLAAGARARAFPGTVEPGTELLYLRNLDDAALLAPRLSPGRRIGIVGAGFIGLELASTARTLGAEVVLIESAQRPLARLLPAAFAEAQLAVHRAHGVEILLGQRVERLAPGSIHLASGRQIDVDTLVIGIGARANDELAATCGLAVHDGVLVNAAGCSSDPAIYAVGDVARHRDAIAGIDRRLESWRNAEDSAQAVAASVLGLPSPASPVPWFWTDQYGRNIQIAGFPDDSHRCVLKGGESDGPSLAYYLDASDRLCGVIGIDSARELRGAMKLIAQRQPVEIETLAAPRPRMLQKMEALPT